MAGPDGNGIHRFEVHCSGAVMETIRQTLREAARQGRGQPMLDAFKDVVRRLKVDPFHTGEPEYRLPGLRMQVRSVAVRPLAVGFAVCEDRPLVFIKGVKLLGAAGAP
jgi:hypothetical protein